MSSSQLLLRLPRWVVVRMARSRAKECHGCGRWKLRFLAVLVLSCVLGSLWVLCEVEDCGFLWRKERGRVVVEERPQVSLEQFNLNKSQLQALVFLLSAMGQWNCSDYELKALIDVMYSEAATCPSFVWCRKDTRHDLEEKSFSECLDKSVIDMPRRASITHAIKVLCSRWDHVQSQQEWMTDTTNSHDQCPVLDVDTSGKFQNSSSMDGHKTDDIPKDTVASVVDNDVMLLKVSQNVLHPRWLLKSKELHLERIHKLLGKVLWLALFGAVGFCKGSVLSRIFWKSSNWQVQQQKQQKQRQQDSQPQNSKGFGRWRKKLLFLGVSIGVMASVWLFLSMNASIILRRKENLATMCDERARMLQDQFNVSMNHVNALAILVSTFHHGKDASAIDQKTFAEYTARTSFERPLISGVAYALKVPHSQREQFEKQHGWRIKKMETEDQSPVQDDYIPEKLDPSPDQDEYAPVIFFQETVSHIISVDMMSGKEDRENILRARASGKGVLTSPFNLLKSNHLGVVLTFAVYNTDLPPNATPEERTEATVGYLGASFDVPSLVERLLQQLASKQTIIVNVYDTTNSSAPTRMYGPEVTGARELHISNLDFGDPIRRHEMHCRFKQEAPPPWSAITASFGVAVIVLLVGHIFHAAINRIEKVEDDYREMRDLKTRAEAADVAKSQFLATVSHEIRNPMNGVLGMLQLLMDTDLDATQQDFAMTAQASGKTLIALINEVLDQAKIESGRLELEAVPFDVRDVLDNVLSIFSDKSQAKGIELAAYVSEQVPEVLIGDPGRFRQIITNLVGNSVKFTEEGHIFVSVHLMEEVKSSHEERVSKQNLRLVENGTEVPYDKTLSECQVVERWKSWQNFRMLDVLAEGTDAVNLLVTVEDTGVGIPLDAQSRIFMPFMQADSSTSRTYGGTGIGLSISKCLVELMGGEIGFVSKPGIGSTFSFTGVFWEGRKNSVDMKTYQEDQTVSDFHGMRGLVVDGRGIRAEVTRYHLQRLGIQVDISTNQESAISSILDACNSRTGHVDMVLVDKEAWGEGSGLAFPHPLREMQQNGTLKPQGNLPKMFLLATSLSPAEIDELKSAGYVDSMIKPLRLSMVGACLRRAFDVGNKKYQEKGQPMALQSLLKGKQILVVDDNAVNCKVAAGALKKFRAVVTCADSGKLAIELLQPPHKFDACFMDVQMPEMDGFEATKQIRCMENKVNDLLNSGEASREMNGNLPYWHIPILAMTADVFQATHEECLRCGMDGYVSKPFEEEQLYSAVAHFFEADTVDPVS